jgi:prevent-host-death family protein
MVEKKAPGVSGQVPAATFKAQCLELMDRVKETGSEYVITKHGRPVARLVPYEDTTAKTLFGCMKGTILKFERPLDPIDGDYDIDRV